MNQSKYEVNRKANNETTGVGIFRIHYVDATDTPDHQIDHEKPISTLQTVNVPGQPFSYFKQYIQNIPVGYWFGDVVYQGRVTDNGSNVPHSFLTDPQDIYVELIKKGERAVKGRFVINYQDEGQNDRPTQQLVAHANAGQPFDLHKYLAKLRADQKLTAVVYNGQATPDGHNVPRRFLSGSHSIGIRYRRQSHQPLSTVQIMYLDQNNQVIGLVHSISGFVGRPVKVTDRYPVPKGYALKPGQKTDYRFQPASQLVTLKTTGRIVHVNCNVEQVIRAGSRTLTRHAVQQVTGRVGDHVDVMADRSVPSDCKVVPDQPSQSLLVRADGTRPATVKFSYFRKPAMGAVTIHYRNLNDMRSDLKRDTVKGTVGHVFDLNAHLNRLPRGYSFVQPLNRVARFSREPQSVIVQVRRNVERPSAQVTMTVVYENAADHSIVNSYQTRGKAGTPFDYAPYVQQRIPRGYRYLKMGRHSGVYRSNAQNVIFVKRDRPQQQNSAAPKRLPSNLQANQVGSILVKLGQSLSVLGQKLNQDR